MDEIPENALTWRRGLWAILRAWKPLLVCELLMSLVTTAVVGPLVLVLSYQLIGISGEGVLGNWDLIRFLLSPIGLTGVVLVLSVTLGLLFIDYAALILLADAALRGTRLSMREWFVSLLNSAPRLFGLAVLQTGLVIAIALPFAGLALLAYWALLGDADINYFVDRRPPRFWAALTIGCVLSIGFTLAAGWCLLRWALAVPACVLDKRTWLEALRSSTRLMRGRAWRLLLILFGWQLLQQGAFAVALVGLDWVNEVLFLRTVEQLSFLLWSTVALLLIDTVVLQLLGSIFAIGVAAFIAMEYERACRSQAEVRVTAGAARTALNLPTWPSRRTRVAALAIAMIGPLASIAYALALTHEFVEHRPARVTAHRAGPKSAPENSLAALRLSIAARADFVEIDVQQTADGQVVLLHDRDLRRVTGDPRVLNDVNLGDLDNLRLTVAGQATDERIPTLQEFLAHCKGEIRLNIELKDFGQTPNLANAVVDVVRKQGLTDRVVVSCFDLPLLAQVRQMEPSMPIGLIVSAIKGDMSRLPVNFFSMNQWLIRPKLVRDAHHREQEIHVWTVNDRETALRLLDLGCDNLITSDPVLIREVVDWYANLGDAERLLLRLRRWLRE